MNPGDLSDAQLLRTLKSLCGESRVLLARLLAHLGEVEKRRLYLEAACPSMFQFCVLRLGMSEDEACRRIHVARLAIRFPDLLVRIERGDLTLSTIALLHGALAEATYEELVEAVAGKTKAEVQAYLAKRSPMPDVPAAITAIPTQPSIPTLGVVAAPAPATANGPQLVPLSETRHKVQFTASDELRKKLERAQDLMRHANAEGDLAVVVDRAMDLLIDQLEKQRLDKTSRPRSSRPRARRSREGIDTTRVSRATHRAVFERDGERCPSAAPSPTPKGIAALRRPGSSSITSPHERSGARANPETSACAAAPTPPLCRADFRQGARRAQDPRAARSAPARIRARVRVRILTRELRSRGERPGEHGFPSRRSAARARDRERAPSGGGAGHDSRPNHPSRGAGDLDVEWRRGA